jgi:hypothetical protein
MKEKLQESRAPEVKQRKQNIESIQESISRVETALTMAIADGNKRAAFSAQRVLDGLQKRLADAKKRD